MRDRLYTTADLARVCGVSISTIKRWTDSGLLRCARTPGGHRKFRMQDVAQAARQLGATLTQTDASSDPEHDELALLLVQSNREGIRERAQTLLALGDAEALRSFAFDLHRHGMSLTAVGDRVLGACESLGSPSDPAQAFLARRAEQLTERLLYILLDQVPAAPDDAPVALVCGSGRRSRIATLLACLALAEAEWRCHDLGLDVPEEVVERGLDLLCPRLVVLPAPSGRLVERAAARSTRIVVLDTEPLAALQEAAASLREPPSSGLVRTRAAARFGVLRGRE